MSTNFRVLCAELVEQVQRAISDHGLCLDASDALMHRARAALATALEGGPSDEELYALWDKQGLEGDFQDCRRFYRIAAARYGTPAPADGDLQSFCEWYWRLPDAGATTITECIEVGGMLAFSKALLARYGTTPTPPETQS